MLSLENIGERFKAIINLFLIILQLIAVSAYYGMVNTKTSYQEISKNIFPDSNHLMDSILADLLVSYPAFFLSALFLFLAC